MKKMKNNLTSLAELGEDDGGVCLVCKNKKRQARLLRISREDGSSITCFNICKDCLKQLTYSMVGAVCDFQCSSANSPENGKGV